MKNRLIWIVVLVIFRMMAHAAITVPGADGSDGVLSVATTEVIDLSQAVSGIWSNDNTAAAGSGIYDSNKWAVVFKYSSVTIDAGATLSFANHPKRAPVVWLVTGDVTINGTLDLNGQNYVTAPALAEPGPGGFRGGMGIYATGVGNSAGFGPGGGRIDLNARGYGASHATSVTGSPDPYGNPAIVPLIGGSGGGGGKIGSASGGAGGGAILIACSGTLTINGTLRANGGNARDYYNEDSGGGSGGGIRLIADTMSGSGTVEAQAGSGSSYPGSVGRVRMERVTNNNTWTAVAPGPSVVGLTAGDTALLWPTELAPTVRIVSIGGEPAPIDPFASFGTSGADVAIPQTNTTQVVIETVYVEDASVVKVRLTPRSNASYTEVTAAFDSEVSADPLTIRWVANVPVASGYSAVQVHVVRP